MLARHTKDVDCDGHLCLPKSRPYNTGALTASWGWVGSRLKYHVAPFTVKPPQILPTVFCLNFVYCEHESKSCPCCQFSGARGENSPHNALEDIRIRSCTWVRTTSYKSEFKPTLTTETPAIPDRYAYQDRGEYSLSLLQPPQTVCPDKKPKKRCLAAYGGFNQSNWPSTRVEY